MVFDTENIMEHNRGQNIFGYESIEHEKKHQIVDIEGL